MLNFYNFARYGAICKIACYIALKHHSVGAILNIARYFSVVLVWSKQSYDKGVK
jgi:hypothetical protein